MDGLVSTGKIIPFTILKRIFANIKELSKNFINILNPIVDKGSALTRENIRSFKIKFVVEAITICKSKK